MLQRIKVRRDFVKANREGRKAALPGVVLQVRPHKQGENPGDQPLIRVGYTVTKKVGNAVVRNRARRRLRAVSEDVLAVHARPGFDYILIGRHRTLDRPYQALLKDLCQALKRLDVYVN